jgi:hypothetical protein
MFYIDEAALPSAAVNATVVAAVLTGSVTAAGWFVSKLLDVRSQTRLKRADFRRAYIQKQIEELYGPLYSLVSQIITLNNLKHDMFQIYGAGTSERIEIDRYFAEEYFLPIHGRVKSILETKLFLVDGTAMPESFYSYLKHSLQETVQHDLWFKKGVDTKAIRGLPYPNEFQKTIRESLLKLLAEYETNVQQLKESSRSKQGLERSGSQESSQQRIRDNSRRRYEESR